MKQKLVYQERLYEKEIAASTAEVVDDITDKLKDMAFDLGTRLIIQFIRSGRKKRDNSN